MEDIEKSNRGGKREGAGRKKKTEESRSFSFRLEKTLADKVDAQPNKSEFIARCIRNAVGPDFSKLGEAFPATAVKEMSLPFFDINIVAGFPIPLDNDEIAKDIEILKLLCPHPESSYLIRVEGDSMIDAGVYSGDIVIVDKSNRKPSPREIAVCELNGEYTLKRFVIKDGAGWLVPCNDRFPEIKVTENDTFCVWGTVTYIIHKARL